jgi:hypothetical protein
MRGTRSWIALTALSAYFVALLMFQSRLTWENFDRRSAAPEWTVDLKALGTPGPPRQLSEFRGRTLRIAFSASKDIFVSFVQYGSEGELKTRQNVGDQARLVFEGRALIDGIS